MLKLAAVLLLAGTFLFSTGCCWRMRGEGRHHRYGQASELNGEPGEGRRS